MKSDNKQVRLISKKGHNELKKSVSDLEHEIKMAQLELKDLDKSSSRDSILERTEKLAQLSYLEEKLVDKRSLLSDSRVMPTRRARLRVAVGSMVDLIDQQGRLFRYTIVDSFEADPSDGRISAVSPLGQGLIGKTIKDVVQWSNGSKTFKLQLTNIQ